MMVFTLLGYKVGVTKYHGWLCRHASARIDAWLMSRSCYSAAALTKDATVLGFGFAQPT